MCINETEYTFLCQSSSQTPLLIFDVLANKCKWEHLLYFRSYELLYKGNLIGKYRVYGQRYLGYSLEKVREHILCYCINKLDFKVVSRLTRSFELRLSHVGGEITADSCIFWSFRAMGNVCSLACVWVTFSGSTNS